MTDSQALSEGTLRDWLRPIEDPELNMSLEELGLIYDIRIQEGNVDVDMTLTSPGCPAADYLVQQVKDRLEEHESVKTAKVQLVWEPKWDAKEMASEEAKEKLGLW